MAAIEQILVVKVTILDETLTVKPHRIQDALDCLLGRVADPTEIDIHLKYFWMDEDKFNNLPDWS